MKTGIKDLGIKHYLTLNYLVLILLECILMLLIWLNYHLKQKYLIFGEYKPIVLDHYLNPKPDVYIDIFTVSFEEYCFNYADKITKNYKNDPMLLGYCMADCPIFTEGDINLYGGTSWARKLRNLGSNHPGKEKYLSMVKNKYLNIENF